MPRDRGAARQRTNITRPRGDHNDASTGAADARRVEHVADPTTDSFQIFLNQVGKYPLLTREEEVELAKRIESGDLAAKEKLINSNLRLVIKFARGYQGHGLSLQDLVQEAMLGLIRATEKFDYRKGFKFSTYAVLWIRQAIQRGLDNTGRQVRIPAHVAQRERSINRISSELAAKLDRDPTDEEVAEAADVTLDEVLAVRDLTKVTTSLDTPIGDGDATFGDLQAEKAPGVEEQIFETEQEQAVGSALAVLPEQERKVIQLRFGTGGSESLSIREIANRLGVTQKVAKELEERGLERLAHEGSLSAWN
jgi:RNA polymerase primary sigma factor